MRIQLNAIARCAALAVVVSASPLFVSAQTVRPAGAPNQPAAAPAQSLAEWQRKHDMALQYSDLEAFYKALQKEAANKPKAPLPDWTGIWTADGGGGCVGGSQCFFRPVPGGPAPKLTPVAVAELKKGTEMNARGDIYDENLSQCGPAGFPRWLQEPFLREFVPTPTLTLLITEQANEIRRIYTDGRPHTPEADRYPLAEGDSIGFWDGQKLVIHTNELQARAMGRNQPSQSEQMQTVEIWEKINPTTIAADVWASDPRLYLEPWYMQRRYTMVPNPDKSLRVRYWDCSENSNNDVIKTQDGGTGFKDLTFTDKSKEKFSQ